MSDRAQAAGTAPSVLVPPSPLTTATIAPPRPLLRRVRGQPTAAGSPNGCERRAANVPTRSENQEYTGHTNRLYKVPTRLLHPSLTIPWKLGGLGGDTKP